MRYKMLSQLSICRGGGGSPNPSYPFKCTFLLLVFFSKKDNFDSLWELWLSYLPVLFSEMSEFLHMLVIFYCCDKNFLLHDNGDLEKEGLIWPHGP